MDLPQFCDPNFALKMQSREQVRELHKLCMAVCANRFAGDSHGTPRPRSAVRFVRQRRGSGRLPREVAACLTSTFLRIFMNFLYAFTLESE